MINLLPSEIKESYRYARRNVALRNWAAILFISFIGLGCLATYGLLTMRESTHSYSVQAQSVKAQLQKDKLEETQKKVEDISGSLKLAVQVLSQEVLFSKLITQIGAAMPSGSILTGLNINKVSGGLSLSADATTYTSATQVQVNLADPENKIFAKVDIDNISCSSETSADSSYPCTVQLRALFNNNNPFLFINQGAKP
jgi:hypothetical protein